MQYGARFGGSRVPELEGKGKGGKAGMRSR